MSGQESIAVGNTTVFNWAVTSVDELIERYQFHPAQIVQNRDGSQVHSVVRVVRDVWYQAMWHARSMSKDEIERWLAEPGW